MAGRLAAHPGTLAAKWGVAPRNVLKREATEYALFCPEFAGHIVYFGTISVRDLIFSPIGNISMKVLYVLLKK
jgi:hypothetical protein